MAMCAMACNPANQRYFAPRVPADQLALVTLDKRASVLDVDGLAVTDDYGKARTEFFVGTGCRQLSAKYEESYFIWDETTLRYVASSAVHTAVALAESESHDYQTMKPIRFFIPARAGYKYWVTASFTGDEFLPRVVEIDPSGDAGRKFLPNQPCGTSTQP